MIVFERRFDLVIYVVSHRFATADELKQHFGVAKSTIHADMNALSRNYPIIPIRGHGGGYQYSGEVPVFLKHAEMLLLLSEVITTMGGIRGFDAVLMKEAIHVLMNVEVHGHRYYF